MSDPVLYIDLGSPYAYLAVERAPRLLGAMPRIAPVALGAIFRHRGRGSWAQTDTRAAHVAEIERRAQAYGLPPVEWPADFPSNSLHAGRCVLWAGRHGLAEAFTRAAFRAAFVEGRSLADHDVLHEAAAAAGLPAAELEEAIAADELKQELKDRTTAAIELGVPGVPTLAVAGELFYGDDRLDAAVARHAG